MPRIHYPKGIGTSRVLGRYRPAVPRPAAGSPFFTKAHETLTRRPGESGLSFPRTSPVRPPQPEPVPKGRFPSHGGLPRPRHSSGLASGGSDLEGIGRRGPSRGSVSAGRSLRSRFSSRTGTCRLRHGSRFRLSSGPRPPRTDLCVLSDEPRGPQLTALHPHRLRRLVWRPTPNYEPGATGNTQGLSRRRW